MKFGINIPNFGPGTTPESMLRWARFAEDTGFHFIMISDHVAVTPDVQPLFPAPFYDPFVSLAWLAAHTHKVDIGTTVTILPYRHPLLTARLAANIDQMSHGRFILGVGVGWARKEFQVLNIPFAKRGHLADEFLDIIKRCWAADVIAYEGQFMSFQDVQTGPRPWRPGGPPVWVGGSSKKAMRRAVRFGDAWHPYKIRLNWLRSEALPTLRRYADEAKKPAPPLCPRVTLNLTKKPWPQATRFAGQGTLQQIQEDLDILSHLGAGHVLLDTYQNEPEQTYHPEKDWEMLSQVAESLLGKHAS